MFHFRIILAYPLFWRCGMRTAGDKFVSSSPGSSETPSCGRSWAWDNRSPRCIWQLFEPAQVPSKVRGCIGWDNSSTQVGTVWKKVKTQPLLFHSCLPSDGTYNAISTREIFEKTASTEKIKAIFFLYNSPDVVPSRVCSPPKFHRTVEMEELLEKWRAWVEGKLFILVQKESI